MAHNIDETWDKSYKFERVGHWDSIARKMDSWSTWGGYYHQRIMDIYKFLIPPGQRVLEIGCGRGDLLAAVQPSNGFGVDFSGEMISRARKKYPGITFLQEDAHGLSLNQTFDAIIISDLINDLWDVQTVFETAAKLSTPRTRLIVNTYSRLWQLPLALSSKLGLSRPNLGRNWLTVDDTKGLLGLSGFEVIKTWQEILWPFKTPFIEPFINRFLTRVWPFNEFALANFILARPSSNQQVESRKPVVSVVVPARNEEGNIPEIFNRVPSMGGGTELIFVEGNSRDDTYNAIQREIHAHPQLCVKLFKQTGVGKGDAVRLGFRESSGEILMILDADLTVPPEDLPRFYCALSSGLGEFINGVRLVYPMQKEAMRFFNLVGNKFFSLAFSWLLSQPIKDTLCGTKALWKQDYIKICENRSYFGDFDPFGDYDLLFGAAKMGLKIVDLPIRYRERTYGTTNIQRWKHGWLLLRMVRFAALRIKFI